MQNSLFSFNVIQILFKNIEVAPMVKLFLVIETLFKVCYSRIVRSLDTLMNGEAYILLVKKE